MGKGNAPPCWHRGTSGLVRPAGLCVATLHDAEGRSVLSKLPLEQLEGAIEQQSRILREELERLREVLETGSAQES